MQKQTIILKTGDEIGFVHLANGVDENDSVFFCKVIEVTEADGERAYRYQFPDGTTARSVIRQSQLASHVIRIRVRREGEPICLNDRNKEFFEALKRARANDLEVFPHWERDTFIVVNRTRGTEYKVSLETVRGRVFASCECGDFKYRNRLCKHVGEVLRDVFENIRQPIGRRGLQNAPLANLMTRFSSFGGK